MVKFIQVKVCQVRPGDRVRMTAPDRASDRDAGMIASVVTVSGGGGVVGDASFEIQFAAEKAAWTLHGDALVEVDEDKRGRERGRYWPGDKVKLPTTFGALGGVINRVRETNGGSYVEVKWTGGTLAREALAKAGLETPPQAGAYPWYRTDSLDL